MRRVFFYALIPVGQLLEDTVSRAERIALWVLGIVMTVVLVYGEYQRSHISFHCINDVFYIQFPTGVSVQYTPDGKIETCPPRLP